MSSGRKAVGRAHARDLRDVRRCLEGEADAYRRLVERHQRQVSSIMWRFSRDADTHEDLVQDVFVEAYQSLRTYGATAPFSHWVARIATRVGYRYWRQRQREGAVHAVSLENCRAALEQPAEAMEPGEAANILCGLLEQLPPRDRLVLTLRYVEGQSVEGIAQVTGWSVTMVKVQAWRARAKLRRLFEKATQGAER